MKFAELKFKPHPILPGVQARVFFDNGLGASVVKTNTSYGGKQGLYELAVLKEGEGMISRPDVGFDDVQGWLNEEQVELLLNNIEKLETV